jgi:hypothetical protein
VKVDEDTADEETHLLFVYDEKGKLLTVDGSRFVND